MLTSAAVSGCPLHSQRSTPVMKRWPGRTLKVWFSPSHRHSARLCRRHLYWALGSRRLCQGKPASWRVLNKRSQVTSRYFVPMLSDRIIKANTEHFWNALIFTLQIKPNWGGPTESQSFRGMGFKYSRTIEKAQILSRITWNRSSSSSSQGSWQPWEAQGQFQEE